MIGTGGRFSSSPALWAGTGAAGTGMGMGTGTGAATIGAGCGAMWRAAFVVAIVGEYRRK